MPAQLLIFSSKDSNMRYATGLDIPDPFISAKLNKQEFILVPQLEFSRAKKEAKKGIKVLCWDALETDNIRNPKHRKKNLADIAASFLLSYTVDNVLIPENTWAIHVETLREHNILSKIQSPFFPGRTQKNPGEITAIKRVGEVTAKAFARVATIIEQSTVEWNDTLHFNGEKLTSESVRAEIERVLLADNCESGETIVACGEQSAEPHNKGTGPLYAGKPIVVDIFPRCQQTGYYFDCTRTFVKGTPSADLQAMLDAVQAAQKEALAVLCPGKAKHVHEVVHDTLKQAGFTTSDEEGFIHSTGHGLGVDIHEPPRISGKSEDVLEEGMVVTIEPGLYYKDIGGVRIEDTVLITKEGYKHLGKIPKAIIL